ncbi:hypothetical protein IQ07DRAFT_600610 [Pyrenochaeta sp. DS3sAY3a]|nr:hypothetical protein IQ07DRAFT_600610 [Pyrenochaeta sp. DS3sAY3a]
MLDAARETNMQVIQEVLPGGPTSLYTLVAAVWMRRGFYLAFGPEPGPPSPPPPTSSPEALQCRSNTKATPRIWENGLGSATYAAPPPPPPSSSCVLSICLCVSLVATRRSHRSCESIVSPTFRARKWESLDEKRFVG